MSFSSQQYGATRPLKGSLSNVCALHYWNLKMTELLILRRSLCSRFGVTQLRRQSWLVMNHPQLLRLYSTLELVPILVREDHFSKQWLAHAQPTHVGKRADGGMKFRDKGVICLVLDVCEHKFSIVFRFAQKLAIMMNFRVDFIEMEVLRNLTNRRQVVSKKWSHNSYRRKFRKPGRGAICHWYCE